MSGDHRRRPIDSGSVSRSRDRWGPPDQGRKRRPAGTEAANLEKTGDNNSNAAGHSLIKLQEQANQRQRRQRIAELVWKLGARAFFEFVGELDRHHDIPDLDQRLERFANADPHLVALLGGDRFPAGPTRIVGRAR